MGHNYNKHIYSFAHIFLDCPYLWYERFATSRFEQSTLQIDIIDNVIE